MREIAQACLLATPDLKMALLGNLSRQEKLNQGHGIMNGFPTVLHFCITNAFLLSTNYEWLLYRIAHFIPNPFGHVYIYEL